MTPSANAHITLCPRMPTQWNARNLSETWRGCKTLPHPNTLPVSNPEKNCDTYCSSSELPLGTHDNATKVHEKPPTPLAHTYTDPQITQWQKRLECIKYSPIWSQMSVPITVVVHGVGVWAPTHNNSTTSCITLVVTVNWARMCSQGQKQRKYVRSTYTCTYIHL